MMKLWRNRRASSEDDTEIELTDVDLESGFGSDSSTSSLSHAAAFGRSAGEERRRLVRSTFTDVDARNAMCSC